MENKFSSYFKNRYGAIVLFHLVHDELQQRRNLSRKQQKKDELKDLQNDQSQQTTLAVDAKSYTEIMDNLYGKGNYNIAEAVKVSDEDSNYDVKEVSSGRMVRGYLIDIDRGQDNNYENTIFVDHSVENPDNITYYNLKEGVQEGYDLTTNPNYPEIGFHPTEPPVQTFGRPFIGSVTVITWIQLDDGSWTKSTVTNTYVCWIRTSHHESTEHFPPGVH